MRKPSREQIARNLQYEDMNLLKSPAEVKAIYEKRKKKEEAFRACLSPELLAFYDDMKRDDLFVSVFREVEAYELGWGERESQPAPAKTTE